MARKALHREAITLRKEGKTFTEIKLQLGVSKSTLFSWLHDLALTKEQLSVLSENKEKRRYITAEKIRDIKLKKRKIKYNLLIEELKHDILPFSNREVFLAGLFLYWGEGTKGYATQISLTNTDSKMMKFFLYWLVNSLQIPKDKVRVSLHLYHDMSVEESIKYWSEELEIPTTQFIKPYIKKSSKSTVDQKGYGKGTCCIYVSNARLKERITGYLDVFSNFSLGV